MLENKINNTVIRLEKGDLTAMEIEAIVFYADPGLVLGSGFGSAISARGGMSIQEELKQHGTVSTGEAVITSAGALNSSYIIHAVGPRFQEDGTELKLRQAVKSAIQISEENNIRKLAFPPMGTGFYGIPLDLCAQVMLEEIKNHLNRNSQLEEVVICVLDNREFAAFRKRWADLT